MDVGDALQICAEKHGLSDVQIAAAVGASEGTVARWRAKKMQPRHEHYLKLAKLFPELPGMVGVAA